MNKPSMTGRDLMACLTAYSPYRLGMTDYRGRAIGTLESCSFETWTVVVQPTPEASYAHYAILGVKPALYALADVPSLPRVLGEGSPSPLHTLISRLGIIIHPEVRIDKIRQVEPPEQQRLNRLHFVCSTVSASGAPWLEHEVLLGADGYVSHRYYTAGSKFEPAWMTPTGPQILAAFAYLTSLHVAIGRLAYAPEWYTRKPVAKQEGGQNG